MPTPRVIHFIWAGGEKPFPNHEVLERWQTANPDCQVVLWIDKKSTPKSVFESYKKDKGYLEAGADAPAIDKIIDNQISSKSTHPKPIVFADITEAQVTAPPVQYEINRFRRNYGCSSDLLRYKILAKYGGAYFDSDIDPGIKPLSEGYNFDSKEPQLHVTHNTQNRNNLIGNDAFICSPHHPEMEEFAIQVEKNYEKAKLNDPNTYDNLDIPYPGLLVLSKRGWDTLERTGPSAVKNFLKSLKNPGYKALSIEVFKSHSYNDRNWVDVPIKVCENFLEALEVAKESMHFETSVMKMGRFAEHVKDISLSLQEPLLLQIIGIAKEGLSSFLTKPKSSGKDAVIEIKKMIEAFLEKDLGIIRPKTKEGVYNDLYKRLDDNFLEITGTASRHSVDKIFEKCMGMVANELVRRGYNESLFKVLKLDEMNVKSQVVYEANEVFKRFSELGVGLKRSDKFTVKQLIEGLNILQPTQTGKLSEVEKRIGNILLIELSQMAKKTPKVKEANFAKLDNRYGMPEMLWAVTLPLKEGFEKSLKKSQQYLDQSIQMLEHYQQMVKFNTDLKIIPAQEALEQVKACVEKVEQFYQDTLNWWSKQEELPQTLGELNARLEEIQALCLDTKACYVEAQLATQSRTKESGIEGYIKGIRGAAEGHRGAAKGLRGSLEAEVVIDKINQFKI